MGINIDSIDDIKAELEVCLGAKKMTLTDFTTLEKGSVIDIGIPAGSPSFVLINGEPVAKGEIMVFEKNLAIRLNKIFDTDDIYYYPKKYFGTN